MASLFSTLKSYKDSHAFVLNGNGSSQLRQFELTTAVRAPHDDLLYFSYVRSHATGSLNDFNNYLANFPPAVILPNYYGALPGDVPESIPGLGHASFSLETTTDAQSGIPDRLSVLVA